MTKLRMQLAVGAGIAWAVWLLMYATGWIQTLTSLQIALAALVQLLLYLGLALAVGAVSTHILIVRDGELYERVEDEAACCADGFCQDEDQSNKSS